MELTCAADVDWHSSTDRRAVGPGCARGAERDVSTKDQFISLQLVHTVPRHQTGRASREPSSPAAFVVRADSGGQVLQIG